MASDIGWRRYLCKELILRKPRRALNDALVRNGILYPYLRSHKLSAVDLGGLAMIHSRVNVVIYARARNGSLQLGTRVRE